MSGGEPRITRTRIPVWALEQARRLGATDAELLHSYPALAAEDLAHAWAYVRGHPNEIEQQIQENEETWLVARLYAGENFPRQFGDGLRQLGHDVLTVAEAGYAEQTVPDEEVMAFATSQKRAVLTINRRHFIRLHNTQPTHAGTVACKLDLDFVGQARRIDAALAAAQDMASQLLRVNRPAA